jgi:hypothetical protein
MFTANFINPAATLSLHVIAWEQDEERVVFKIISYSKVKAGGILSGALFTSKILPAR